MNMLILITGYTAQWRRESTAFSLKDCKSFLLLLLFFFFNNFYNGLHFLFACFLKETYYANISLHFPMKCCLCLIQLLTVYVTISVTVTFREHIFSILQELTCWSRYVTVSQKAREKWPEWSPIQCLPSLCTRGKTQNKQTKKTKTEQNKTQNS